MTKTRRLALALVATLAVAPLTAQRTTATADDAGVLLQAALHREQVEGKVAEAIELYKQVVERAGPAERDIAARAQLQLARVYEKTGAPDAPEAYRAVLLDFADQPTAVAAAKAGLATLVVEQLPAPRRLWSSGTLAALDISRDGSMALVWVVDNSLNKRDLLLKPVALGSEAILVEGSYETAPYHATFSPDGRRVAYLEGDRSGAGLRADWRLKPRVKVIAATAGAEPSTIFITGSTDASLDLVGWSADGAEVLVLHRTTSESPAALVAIAVADGAATTRRVFPSELDPASFRVSNDGDWIAYVDWETEQIRLLSVDGQRDTAIVTWSGQNRSPVWMPDGSHVLFTSNRNGRRGLYAVPVRNGVATAEPVEIEGVAGGAPVRVAASDTLFYSARSGGGGVVLVAERTAAGATVVHQFTGSAIAISPDGQFVMFDTGPDAVVVRSLETGTERTYSHAGIGAGTGAYLHYRWLPDSSGLIMWVIPRGDGGVAGGGFYHLDLATGTFTRRFSRITPTMHLSKAGALSADGQTMYFLGRPGGTGGEGQWTKIVQVDIASGELVSTVDLGGWSDTDLFSLALSPDQATLALTAFRPPPDGERLRMRLLTVPVSGGDLSERWTFPSSNSPDRLAWTPDSSAVLVGTVVDGAWRIVRVPIAGGAPQPDGFDMANIVSAISLPALHPTQNAHYSRLSGDGSRLAIGAYAQPTFETWALDSLTSFLQAP